MFSFFFVALLTSCSSSSDGELGSNEVVGSWKMISLDIKGTTSEADFSLSDADLNETNNIIHFEEDHTLRAENEMFDVRYQVKMGRVEFSDEERLMNLFGNGTWEKEGNILVIYNDNKDALNFEIQKLTKSTMELKFNELPKALMELDNLSLFDGLEFNGFVELKRI